LTDIPVKNALTPSTRERSEHPREKLCLRNKKEKRATYLKRDLQKQKKNKKNNSKLQAILTKKIPRIIPASIVLAHPEKCGFIAQTASCGHMNYALMALPNVFA
jgi:hypothetical protein